jgi:glycosyltransferase involved in cell wall biosynthesis
VKGIDVLLDAWARVPAPAHLVVVGEGPLSGAMKERAVAVAPGRVTFTGRVPDTAPYLRAADIWVLPSFAEGLPISLLEAMACGLACVATAVGGVPDMVEDGSDGLLVMPGDPELLATALERLSSDLPEARRMGAAARRTAEARFAMGTVARTYAELYDEVPDVIASGAPS